MVVRVVFCFFCFFLVHVVHRTCCEPRNAKLTQRCVGLAGSFPAVNVIGVGLLACCLEHSVDLRVEPVTVSMLSNVRES